MQRKSLEKKGKKLFFLLVAVSICIVLFFIIFFIVPEYRSIQKIKHDIKKESARVETAEKIIPAFAAAKQFEDNKFEPELPFPERKKLLRRKMSQVFIKIKSSALQNNLDLSSNNIDINALESQSSLVGINLECKGRLDDFRNYLISLIELPFFNSVEKFSITPEKNVLKNFSVNIKINIENE